MQCCTNPSSKIKLVNKNVDLLKTISEPNRLKILCILKNGRLCECEIIEYLQLRQNLISHHLNILENASLIRSKREGRKIFYSLNKKEIIKLNNFLNHVLGGTK
jgi:ArsR family transcriptional regulator